MRGTGPTLADIANEAGVSAMTVSKALNGRSGVADETRKRIQALAERLGYVPNLSARGLARGRTNLIGVVTHDLTVQYSTELLRGLVDESSESGQELLISATYQDSSREQARIRRLAHGMVDAIVLIAPTFGSETVKAIDDAHIPVVVLDPRRVEEVRKTCAVIHVDNYRGMRSAAEHLLNLGHVRIGYVGGDPSFDSARDRYRGFIDAIALSPDADIDHTLIADSGYSQLDGFSVGADMLSRDDRPTAIVAASDVAAFGVIDAARSLGLRVPEDLSVVGFDDIPTAEHATPALTTVRQPLYEMGRVAAWVAIVTARGERIPMASHRFNTELVVRGTTMRLSSARADRRTTELETRCT